MSRTHTIWVARLPETQPPRLTKDRVQLSWGLALHPEAVLDQPRPVIPPESATDRPLILVYAGRPDTARDRLSRLFRQLALLERPDATVRTSRLQTVFEHWVRTDTTFAHDPGEIEPHLEASIRRYRLDGRSVRVYEGIGLDRHAWLFETGQREVITDAN